MIFILCWLMSLSPLGASLQNPLYDELEGFDFVEALIRDHQLETAQIELQQLAPSDRYWMLQGDLQTAMKNWPKALENYLQASSSWPQKLSLGRTYFQLQDHKNCELAFAQTGQLWLQQEQDVMAKSTCEWNQGHQDKAWSTIEVARAAFTKSQMTSFLILKQQISFRLQMGMFHAAAETLYHQMQELSSHQILACLELFQSYKAEDQLVALVEMARLQKPLDLPLKLKSAQIFWQKGYLRSTREIFLEAAALESSYNLPVAELSRQLGLRQQAVYFTQLVVDQKEYLKARLAQYIESDQYALVASLEPALRHSELMREDDEVRYALAYSFVQQGQAEKGLHYLQQIHKAELSGKVSRLKGLLINKK